MVTLRQRTHGLTLAELGVAETGVALDARDAIDMLRSLLKRSYSCRRRTSSARGSSLPGIRSRGAWQQHARFDLGKRRGHDQIFAGELELQPCMSVDIVHVLTRDVGDRDVEDVEVLPPDHVQQQVERAFESFEKHLQRLRRDVQIVRQLRHRLAVHHGEWHLDLLGRCHRRRSITAVSSAIVDHHADRVYAAFL